MNQLRKCAQLYFTGEETNWETASPRETSDGVNFRVLVNPGVNKGGQTVIICDYLWVRYYEYSQKNKVQDNPSGWIAMGMVEAWSLLEKTTPMLEGEDGNCRRLHPSNPHVTFDNYFYGYQIFDSIGEDEFLCNMTCRRDSLPKYIQYK